MRKSIMIQTVAVAAVAVVLAGCGGSSANKVASLSSPSPTSSAPPAPGGGNADQAKELDQLRAYAKCMRDNGYDMPDPEGAGMPGIKPDDPKFGPANDKCMSKLPNGGQPQPEDPAQLDKDRKWAKCMRDNGIDIPDPQPDAGMALPDGGDPKVQTALKACASVGR
ncbi:hypothetical protein [Catenulispora rubra]|uniref:hypothetical protein n=1 Tax=Catenulispora rubra TaxID=280293 RepID=UPI00189285E3|nr:hypothetical protein [Catenulispora rubra]